MLTRSARTLAMLAVLGLAAGTAGCGTTLDMAAINKSVSEGITSQLSLAVASTTCPTEARAAKAGDTFECIVTPKEGGRLTVKVTQSDGKGNVQWESSCWGYRSGKTDRAENACSARTDEVTASSAAAFPRSS